MKADDDYIHAESLDLLDSIYNILLEEGRLEEELLKHYNPVELWILRGRYQKTNFDLLEDALGHKQIT